MEDLDITMLPEEPPEELFEAMIHTPEFCTGGLVSQNVKVPDPLTGIKEEKVKVICSQCHEVFYADEVIQSCIYSYARGWQFGELTAQYGDTVTCPCCGEQTKVMKSEHFYGKDSEMVYKKHFSAHAIEGRLALVEWRFSKKITRKAEISYEARIATAYVLERRKMNLFQGYWGGGLGKRANCYDNSGNIEEIYGLSAQLLEGTTAGNSKLDVFMKSKGPKYPVSYLRLWQKHPNIENIVMQGCGALLCNLMDMATERSNKSRYYGMNFSAVHRPIPKIEEIDWEQVRPSKMLALSPEEFRMCVRMKWDARFLMAYRAIKEQGVKLTEEDVKLCRKLKIDELEKILKNELPVMKTVRYLLRQQKKYPKDKSRDVTSLRDYWQMAVKAKFDLSVESVRWPQRLQSAHEQAMLQQKFEEEKELISKFHTRFRQLMKLAWEKDGILIRPAENQSELKLEGTYLHHCVASYAKRHADGHTAIFFIRRASEPDVPWFTLELDENTLTVRQNRGKHNCARTEEITAFEKMWLAEIKARKNKKKRSKVA